MDIVQNRDRTFDLETGYCIWSSFRSAGEERRVGKRQHIVLPGKKGTSKQKERSQFSI